MCEITVAANAKVHRDTCELTTVSNHWTMLAIPNRDETLRTIQDSRVDTELAHDLVVSVRLGERRCLWLSDEKSPLLVPMPFWRESVHVLTPHEFWNPTPHSGYADMRFFSVATEYAISSKALMTLIGEDATLVPICRRFDARRFTMNEYIVEMRIGYGRLYVSSLRFAGGSGQQPARLRENPIGASYLRRF